MNKLKVLIHNFFPQKEKAQLLFINKKAKKQENPNSKFRSQQNKSQLTRHSFTMLENTMIQCDLQRIYNSNQRLNRS